MKKEIKNISFKGGIVENYKQDYFTQQEWYAEHMLTSALYMENYNPNIEYHSLVLRPGLDILANYLNTGNLVTGFSGITKITYNSYNHLKALLVQHYARMNYVDSETNFNKLDALFTSNILTDNELPEYHKSGAAGQKIWVTNIRFHGVEPINNIEDWQTAFNINNKQGYLPLGKFRDMVRNGSKFLFVTEPTSDLYGNENLPVGGNNNQRDKRLYFPVYTFEQVKDPKKVFLKARRETTYDYLNGLTETDLDDAFWNQVALRRFRIKYPAPIFKDNDAITTVIRSQKTLRKDYSHIERWLALNPGKKSETYLNLPDATIENIKSSWLDYMQKGYAIGNAEFANDEKYKTIIKDNFTIQGTDDINIPRIELLVWEQPLLWDLQDGIIENEFENPTKKMGYSFFGNDTQDTWSLFPCIDYELSAEGKNPETNKFYKNPYLESFLKPNHNTLNSFIKNATNTRWKDVSLTLNNETYRFWGLGESYKNISSNVAKTVYHAARFVAHDYIRVELPRSWMKGDKIPFLLTATMNGQEIVLLKETYEVGKNIRKDNDLVVRRPNDSSHVLQDYMLDRDPLSPFEFPEDFNQNTLYTSSANNSYTDLSYLLNIDRKRADYDNSIELTKVNGIQENEVGIAPVDSLLLYDTHGRYFVTRGNVNFTTDLSGFHNTIQFTVRLNKDALAILLAQGISNIKVYASRPNNDKKLFDKVGSSSLTDAPPIYAKPIITENSDDRIIEGTNYGLLKTFLIEGKSDIIQDYTDVKRSNYRTNAWKLDNDWIYAIPVNEGDREAGLSTLIVEDGNNLPYFYFKSSTQINQIDNLLYNYYNNFTPDFFLWDYPSDTESYTIGDSGQYWEGTGARCITSVKGRTFIGGTFDKDFTEEQGTVRWSSLNNGSHITDLFAEEARLQVGHLPITSLLEYREQLWVFNKDNYYRVMLNEIGNVNSWEFVDSKFGQGTYSPKTVCKTPYGVCFASEGGIFLSDGTNPLNLVDNAEQVLSIKSLYQHLMLGNTYQYSQINNPGEIFIEPGKDYNIYAELYYDTEKDELVLTTPIKKEDDSTFNYSNVYYELDNHLSNTHWYKLIYSFANKNWRAESGAYYAEGEENGNYITYGEYGRMWENERVARNTIKFDNTFDPTDLSNNAQILTGIYAENINRDWDRLDTTLSIPKLYIWGRLSTHEIGNGEDDHILNKVILECTPKENKTDAALDYNRYVYTSQNDPYLGYELRNRTYVNQLARFNEIDLVAINMAAKGGLNPFTSIMITPTADTANYTMDGGEVEVGRESLNMIAPMSKFRRTRFRLVSRVIAKIRTLTVSYKVFNRRNY